MPSIRQPLSKRKTWETRAMALRLSRWVRETLLLAIVVRTSAAETNTQFAPDMWAYLDIAFKPLLRRRLRVADWARNKYLWVRVRLAG
jgi:hypothetical protein